MENEFLKLVYGPPAYFNKLCILELRNEAQKINMLLNSTLKITFTIEEKNQLNQYLLTYANRIKTLNNQYSK